jgi:hypothetical protein
VGISDLSVDTFNCVSQKCICVSGINQNICPELAEVQINLRMIRRNSVFGFYYAVTGPGRKWKEQNKFAVRTKTDFLEITCYLTQV